MRHGSRLPELLFFGSDVYDSLERRRARLREKIAASDRAEMLSTNIDAIVPKIVGPYLVNVPVLHEDQKHAERGETKIDISQDRSRLIWDRGRSSNIDAIQITIWVPFEGDPDLFRIRPQTFTSNPPRGEVSGQEVGFIFVDTNPTPERIDAEFTGWLNDVRQHLAWHQQGVAGFNASLATLARQEIAARQQKLLATERSLASLNIPLKEKAATVASASTGRSSYSAIKQAVTHGVIPGGQHYDCFVSYAGQDRVLVKELVGALEEIGISVWWDKGQIRLGDRLSQKIDEGLTLSRYGLVVVSEFFIAKQWTDFELRALAHRAIREDRRVILPVLVGMGHDRFASTYPLLADIVSTTYRGDPKALAKEVKEALD